MNKSTATRIVNKSINMVGDYSLGFKRLHNIPTPIRISMFNFYWLTEPKMKDSEINIKIKEFLQSLTVTEFHQWLLTK